MEENLVSIIVLTYNSEKTIIETLESIKKQTYPLIELIISDDCSTDKTLTIAKEWIRKNKKEIKFIKIIERDINLGISKNINNACKIAQGKWIKPIAGDDILKKICIEKNVDFFKKNKNIEFIFSKAQIFNDAKEFGEIIPTKEVFEYFKKLDSSEQFEDLCHSNKLVAPTGFYLKESLREIGYFEEMIKNCEDYPTWIKLTFMNKKVNLMNEVTVLYRVNSQSMSGDRKKIINELFVLTKNEIYKKYISKKNILFKSYFKFNLYIDYLTLNFFNTPNKYKIIRTLKLIHPYFYYYKYKIRKKRGTK